MQALYMLDTNICIYLMKRHPPEVAQRFSALFVGQVVISAITLAELEWGICSAASDAEKRNRKALDDFLRDVPVAPFDAAAAQRYGPVRQASRQRTRDQLDKLIAAHALALGVTLVTNNPADFASYPALAIENWVAAH
jgi:tRNA(fMet)-specific endonuclease VapC